MQSGLTIGYFAEYCKANIMAQSLKFSCGGFKASVSRSAEFNDWIVRFYSADGSRMQNADYHTDNKADAISTAQSEVFRMVKRGELCAV